MERDPRIRDRVQQLWLAWTDEADADGLTDFYGLQAMVAREMFVAGECFVRLRPRRAEDGLLVPLQLQLLQSEMLPFEKTEVLPSGNRIRCGIEFDAIGRRVAYHFRRRHPGDSTDQGADIPETVRVPAADVLHIYRPIDAGQIRGLPHIAPAMVRLFLLDQYDDAERDLHMIGIATEVHDPGLHVVVVRPSSLGSRVDLEDRLRPPRGEVLAGVRRPRLDEYRAMLR